MMYMQSGKSPLHRAKSAEIAEVLINNGADIHRTDEVCVAGSRLCAWMRG